MRLVAHVLSLPSLRTPLRYGSFKLSGGFPVSEHVVYVEVPPMPFNSICPTILSTCSAIHSLNALGVVPFADQFGSSLRSGGNRGPLNVKSDRNTLRPVSIFRS